MQNKDNVKDNVCKKVDGWVSVKDRLPINGGSHLVAWKLTSDSGFHYSLAYWCSNIANAYPFKYYLEYKGRKGGGWIKSDPEGDFELTGVEYWMEIPRIENYFYGEAEAESEE